MYCPSCGDEYERGVAICPDCHVALVPEGAVAVATATQPAPLGRFQREVAPAVLAVLEERGVRATCETIGGDVLVHVARGERDDARATLFVSWDAVLGQLDPDLSLELRRGGGSLPGWNDPPTGAWVDREGRLRVGGAPDEEAAEDARRTLGPALATVGLVLLLLGWYVGGQGGLASGLVGGALLVLGVLLPR